MNQTLCGWERRRREKKREERVEFQRLKRKKEGERMREEGKRSERILTEPKLVPIELTVCSPSFQAFDR